MREEDVRLKKTVAASIKAIRSQRGVTQAYVAEQADIDLSHYQRIERGESNPSLLTAYRICQTLCMKLDQLFTAPRNTSET